MSSRGDKWPLPEDTLVLVKGGGDLATGVAHRLHRAGFKVIITELPQPLAIRRAVSFASAVYEGQVEVEGVVARLAKEAGQVANILGRGEIPVVIDPEAEIINKLCSHVVVDAIMAKKNTGTQITDAPIVIGLGPGFTAGLDVHAVIETQRGHDLGRVILEGTAAPNTGVPSQVEGYTHERVLRAPRAGVFRGVKEIGDLVQRGETVAYVDKVHIVAAISGVVRGLLADGLAVTEGMKVGDIDPRGVIERCFTISDKGRAIGGGVLEAILYLLNLPELRPHPPLGRGGLCYEGQGRPRGR